PWSVPNGWPPEATKPVLALRKTTACWPASGFADGGSGTGGSTKSTVRTIRADAGRIAGFGVFAVGLLAEQPLAATASRRAARPSRADGRLPDRLMSAIYDGGHPQRLRRVRMELHSGRHPENTVCWLTVRSAPAATRSTCWRSSQPHG